MLSRLPCLMARQSPYTKYKACALCSLLCLLLVTAPSARADNHWRVTYAWTHDAYTSGTGSTAWQPYSYTGSDSRVDDGPYYYGGPQYSGTQLDSALADGPDTDGILRASASDTVTATLTWVDDDGNSVIPGPKCVLVQEEATAVYTAMNPTDSLSNTGASNGFSDSVQNFDDPYASDASDTATWRVSGVDSSGLNPIPHYSVKDGSSGTITLTSRTLSASVYSTPAPPSDDNYGTEDWASTWYEVVPYNITIDLSGVTPDPDVDHLKLLTGQLVTATLNLGGAPGTVNTGDYQWSVDGDTNKTYDEMAPNTTNTTQLVPIDYNETIGSPFQFFDKKAETINVECIATITFPDASTIDVDVTANPISVLKPTASWGIAPGYVYMSGGITGFWGSPGATVYVDGQNWHDVTVTVPTPFSGGDFCFAQLVTPSRKIYRNLPVGSTASSYYQVSGEGVQALDAVFPYHQPGYSGIYSASASHSGVLDGDSPQVAEPGINIGVSVTDTGGTDWYRSTGSDSLSTWLMYRPSGGVWVPLQKYSWSWNGEQHKVSGAWTFVSGSPSSPPSYTAGDTDTPPQWSSIQLGGPIVSP